MKQLRPFGADSIDITTSHAVAYCVEFNCVEFNHCFHPDDGDLLEQIKLSKSNGIPDFCAHIRVFPLNLVNEFTEISELLLNTYRAIAAGGQGFMYYHGNLLFLVHHFSHLWLESHT